MEDLKTQADYAARYRKHILGYIASIVRKDFKPSLKRQFKESVSPLALACHGRL